MPLIVPALRLVMLFLNIYDSYKTLKVPPPSARNGGNPSQRALSQRKRDMKGCIAVWIVWSCFIMYERLAETLVSLFVPFYNEFKSLVLLFLILTRARGAEPIFLHAIRPFLKPYTPTLDIVLELARMIGDILFAGAAIPIQFFLTWWSSSIFYSEEILELETEGQTPRTDPTHNSAAVLPKNQPLHFPKKACSDRRQLRNNGHSSVEHSRDSSQTKSQTQGNSNGRRVPSNGTDETSKHQIWYPPPSSYSDVEETTTNDSNDPTGPLSMDSTRYLSSTEVTREQEVFDEWRQYPPFPSAYPPTPVAVSSSGLPPSAYTATAHPPDHHLTLSNIPEDPSQQDFRESLLPPRKPLNPGFAGDLSDEIYTSGVRNQLEEMPVDSSSEGEDDFNITLRTPMPPLRMPRSHISTVTQMSREISRTSSIASRSTTLTTTAGHGSSLQSQSSSESLSSSAISVSDLTSVLGKKRALPPDGSGIVKGRVKAFERKTGKRNQQTGKNNPTRRNKNSPNRAVPRHTRAQSPDETISSDTESSLLVTDEADDDNDNISDRRPAHPKRRKILTSPGRAPPARPVRPRVTRHATAPTKPQQVKPPDTRTSSRINAKSTGRTTDNTVSSDVSQASTSSTNNPVRPIAGRKTRPKEQKTK